MAKGDCLKCFISAVGFSPEGLRLWSEMGPRQMSSTQDEEV